MKQDVKEKVIRTTAQLITQYGIRHVRVDEIAQNLGISKRTLYELFHDKTELVNCCLEDIKCRQRNRITAYLQEETRNPLQNIFWLMNEFIGALYSVDTEFLAELRRKTDYAQKYQESKRFWTTHLEDLLQEGQREEYFLSDTDMNMVSVRMMVSMQDSRVEGRARSEQEDFCRIMLRGLSTQKGIEWIDSHSRSHRSFERSTDPLFSSRNRIDASH